VGVISPVIQKNGLVMRLGECVSMTNDCAVYPSIYEWVARSLGGCNAVFVDGPAVQLGWRTPGGDTAERLTKYSYYRADATVTLVNRERRLIGSALWTGKPFNQWLVWIEKEATE